MKMKSKTIVLLGEDKVLSIEETFPQVIESTSDRFTYRIKGIADIDYVEVGIVNAEGTQLLLVDEDAIDGVFSRIAIGGKFYSDIENQDEWVGQYSDLATLIYEDVMPEGYCSHACEIGCAHGWTMGLIRWLDAKLGTKSQSENNDSAKCKTCGEQIDSRYEYCSFDCAASYTGSRYFCLTKERLPMEEDKDNVSAICDGCGEEFYYELNNVNGNKLCELCFNKTNMVKQEPRCSHCGESLGCNPQELDGKQLCELCFTEIAFDDDGQYKEYKDIKNSEKGDIRERTGGETNYYNIEPKEDGYVDVDRICDQLKLTFAEGNTIKALFGIAIERLTGKARHTAAGHHIDAEKFKHYSKQVYMKVSESDGN